MLTATDIVMIVLVYFILVTIFLTILWRMSLALDRISQQLLDIGQDLKKLPSSDSKAEKKEPRRK